MDLSRFGFTEISKLSRLDHEEPKRLTWFGNKQVERNHELILKFHILHEIHL